MGNTAAFASSEGRSCRCPRINAVTWELMSGLFSVFCGSSLTVGSILFLPQYYNDEDVIGGEWFFIMANIVRLSLSTRATLKICCYRDTKNVSELLAAVMCMGGASLFITGSALLLFSVHQYDAPAWSFIVGSVFFLIGSLASMSHSWDGTYPDLRSSRLASWEAVNFALGSSFYVAASIPYLYEFENPQDEYIIYRFLATMYILGSVLFLVGGLLHTQQGYCISQIDTAKEDSTFKNDDSALTSDDSDVSA